MPKAASKTSRPGLAVLLGLAATVLVAGAHWAGADRWLELGTLDARFRWLATAPPLEEIVNVNIDDRSLEELGRWPWPRSELAGIVEVLEQCGARAVALDIILPEPQKVRYEPAAGLVALGEALVPPVPVFDDAALADMIARHENLFIPMHVVPRPPKPTPLESAVLEIIQANPRLSLPEASGGARHRLGLGEAAADPDETARAYLRARALAEMGRFGVRAEEAAGCPAIEGGLVPPLVLFAQAARHTGFVTFDPDGDGTVRRIPLLARYGGRVYPQFALSVAADELARRHGQPCTPTADASGVVLRFGSTQQVVPVDSQGYMLINWSRGARSPAWRVRAGAVGELWRLRRRIESAQERRLLWCKELVGMGRCEKFRTPELQEAYWELMPGTLYDEWDRIRAERFGREARRQEARLYDPARVPPAAPQLAQEQARVEAEIDRRHQLFLAELSEANHLDYFLAKPAGDEAASRPAVEAFETARKKAQSLLGQIGRLPKSAREEGGELEAGLARLRELVAGRICLVGSTATGAADFVPTPMDNRTAGVTVHANIMNTILSGRFVRPAGLAASLLAIMFCGLAVTLVAATRPVWQSAPLVVLIGGAFVAVASLLVFHVWDVWLVMVAPLGAMLAGFLVVTAYRQLTEERAKRHIRSLFAHALSPALVDRLTEDPSLLKLGGEKRVLSCFFSDLAGFTPLAERLGEEGTVRLLNRYFDRMTEVIQLRQGGYLNKFLGDGIFAFFGAPVFQDDHAARAVRAAADCVEALKLLNARLSQELNHEVSLSCRIGIATGEVMVGNCGSTEKFDYTAIGDTVNLASRLEGAGKFFGTSVLVEEETWKQATGSTGGQPPGVSSSEIIARCVGKVLVVGKVEPVNVWNVLGWRKDLSPRVAEAAEEFTRAAALYAARDFPAAAAIFEKCVSTVPEDKAAGVFLDLCRRHAAQPPGPDWDAAIQLTQK